MTNIKEQHKSPKEEGWEEVQCPHEWRLIGGTTYEFNDALYQCKICKIVVQSLGEPKSKPKEVSNHDTKEWWVTDFEAKYGGNSSKRDISESYYDLKDFIRKIISKAVSQTKSSTRRETILECIKALEASKIAVPLDDDNLVNHFTDESITTLSNLNKQ